MSQELQDLYGVNDKRNRKLKHVPGGQGSVQFPESASYSKRTEVANLSSKSSIESGSVERTYRIDDSYDIKPVSKFAAQTGKTTRVNSGDQIETLGANQNYNKLRMTMNQQYRHQVTRSNLTSVFNESRGYGKQATQSVGP